MVSKYRELFNKSADASLIISNGLFVDCNQAAVDMLGFKTKAEVLNTHPSAISPEFQPDGHDSVDKADRMMALAHQNGSHRFEWTHVRTNGDVFPVEVLLTAISQETDNETLFAVLRDLTATQEAQKFQDATSELADTLSMFMDMHEIARSGAAQIRQFFESDAISINFIDHNNRINRGLYAEDTPPGARQPNPCEPLSTSFDNLDEDSIHGVPNPILLNRTEAEIKEKPMDRPFGDVHRKSASLMFVPMVWDNLKIGEVTAQSYTFNKFTDRSLAQLQVFATQIGGALLRAKTSEELRIEHLELLKNQAQLLISQQLAHVGSWEYDVAKKLSYWSAELYRIFDVDPREPITRKLILSKIHPDDLELFTREMESNALVRTDYRIVLADGRIRWIHEEVDSPELKKGTPIFLRGSAQDITSSKEAEHRLAESDKLRELLLDIITHDLKNPAGVILGMSELAVTEMPGNQLLEAIHATSQRLIKVLDETSILTQATFGETIPQQNLDLKELLTGVGEEFTERLSHTKMKLKIDVPENVILYANPLIGEVFKNYISNAIKYASSGKEIVVVAKTGAEAVTVLVNDFGNTIQASDHQRVFERHTQLSEQKKRGRGLGLAIVKRIAAAHQATVWVEPNHPTGNRFCIRIPVPASPRE